MGSLAVPSSSFPADPELAEVVSLCGSWALEEVLGRSSAPADGWDGRGRWQAEGTPTAPGFGLGT